MSFTRALGLRLAGDAERVRQNLVSMVRELQDVRVVRGRSFRDVELTDATETPLNHGLGRPALLKVSPPRNAGTASSPRIEEVRDAKYDRTRTSVLKATGWGATITVDVWCY